MVASQNKDMKVGVHWHWIPSMDRFDEESRSWAATGTGSSDPFNGNALESLEGLSSLVIPSSR